jgi:hypothetical protein
MKPHSCIWVVRRLCGMHIDPVCGCFDNPERLNYRDLPGGRGSRVRELADGLRLSTTLPSQDLSGA